MTRELKYAVRSLLRSPGFTATAVILLAIGIGATSAIFSVVDRVLVRSLPFPHAKRLVHLAWEGDGHLQELSSTKFQYWQEHASPFDAMATWRASLGQIDTAAEVSAIRSLAVSRDFLQVLGYVPAVGRGFVAAEHVPGGPSVAVISHMMWRNRFGGSTDLVGRTIQFDGKPVMIVGVLPESFAFPYEHAPVEILVPLTLTVNPADISENWPTIAHLREGVTPEQAATEVASLMEPFRVAYPNQVAEQDRGMRLATFTELYVSANVRRALWIMMGAALLVLVIACANVANLFLARGAHRREELAVRAALGASRGRIIGLIFAEGALVALAAGALGLLLGTWAVRVLVGLSPIEVRRMADVGLDWRVVAFTFAVAMATSLLFSGIAGWPAARTQPSEMLRERTRGSSRPGRARQGLLVAQSALSTVLLLGAGLLVATLIGLTRVDVGFDPENLVAIRPAAKSADYATSQQLWQFERRVEEALDGSPAIVSIAGASSLPFEKGINTPMTVAGHPDMSGSVEWRAVTPDYFRTLRIGLVAGRVLNDTDVEGHPPVAIVNETFARRYFPGQIPIGQRIDIGRFRGVAIDPSRVSPAVEIVGVVKDIRDVSLRAEPPRTIYVPQAQAPNHLSNRLGRLPSFIAERRSPSGDVQRAVAEAFHAADPRLPRPQAFPLDELVAQSLVQERFGATLVSAIAGIALALTAFGVYGVLAYTVQRRRREIGIRMALGADSSRVTRQVVMHGVVPVLLGIMLGMGGSFGLSRFIAGFLWGVKPTDVPTIATVAAILLGVSALASWVPARNAVRQDSVKALNNE